MTKLSTSGEAISPNDIGKVNDQTAYKWEGKGELDGQQADVQHLATEGVKIVDPGMGVATVLRHFFIKSIPQPKGTPRPTKLELVSNFKKAIELSLWGDGLIIRDDKPIEVHTRGSAKKVSKQLFTKMVQEKADWVILCLAVPRHGQTVLETPLRAQ